uniref:Uncharacterized protein n=1 Tax=Globodera rostochiensis TaxID=31243 RepID=A0A914H935_GLORO
MKNHRFALSKPGVLERFFPDYPQQVAKIRVTFAELWGLGEHDAITEADYGICHKKMGILRALPPKPKLPRIPNES